METQRTSHTVRQLCERVARTSPCSDALPGLAALFNTEVKKPLDVYGKSLCRSNLTVEEVSLKTSCCGFLSVIIELQPPNLLIFMTELGYDALVTDSSLRACR